jgi:hypothetical protein
MWLVILLGIGWLVHYAMLKRRITAYKGSIAHLEVRLREMEIQRDGPLQKAHSNLNHVVESVHCPEEIELLKLLRELQSILTAALDSLANKQSSSAESRYIGDAAISVNHAADAYLLLRDRGRVDASKLFIRPMVDVVISATAVTKQRGFLFRKEYTEFLNMQQTYDKSPDNEARANKYLKQLKQRFQQEPGYPIECKQITARDAAEVAGLLRAYRTAYRIYCEFTHSAVRAVRGYLDNATDPIDTSMVIWAVGVMLNHLRAHTAARIPDLTPFDKRIQEAQSAMLRAWGHNVPEAPNNC